MSILTSTNQSTTETHTRSQSGPILRPSGAEGAPAFAQVLRAFDHDPESSAIDSAQERDSGGAGEDDAGAVDNATDAEGKGARSEDTDASSSNSTDEGEQSGTKDEQQGGTEAAKEGHGQRGDGTGQARSEQGAQADGAQVPKGLDDQIAKDLGLLNNRSDQAKISIRGLVRAIRADSTPDATTIAVQTRLGDVPNQNTNQSPVTLPQPDPDQVRPLETRGGHAGIGEKTRDPVGALSDEPPTSDRAKGETKRTPTEPGAYLQAAKSTPAEQSRPDTQHQRSARADAASLTQQPKPTADPSRAQPLHAVARADLNTRAEGALTSRAVTSVDASGSRNNIDTSTVRSERTPQPLNEGRQALQSKVVAQVQRGLASLMRSASGEMTMRLTPERLGELKIEIKRTGDQLSVRLTTQSSEASDLLRAGTEELTHLLRSKGISIDKVQIEQQQQPGTGEQGAFDLGGDDSSSEQHAHEQHQQDTSGRPGDTIDPFVDPSDDPETIWSELGLDAIA